MYNVQVGGIKAWGNAVQSSSAMGNKFASTDADCLANRTMAIVVWALETFTSPVKVSLYSQNFTTTALTSKPADNNNSGSSSGSGSSGNVDDSNAVTISSFISIVITSIFYLLY